MAYSSFVDPRKSLTIPLLLVAVLSSCTAPRHVSINPEVKASRAGVVITNRDDFAYPRVTIFVKGHYYKDLGDIASGQTVYVPFDKFVDDYGRRFDLQTMTPEVIRVRTWFDGKAAAKNFEIK